MKGKEKLDKAIVETQSWIDKQEQMSKVIQEQAHAFKEMLEMQAKNQDKTNEFFDLKFGGIMNNLWIR